MAAITGFCIGKNGWDPWFVITSHLPYGITSITCHPTEVNEPQPNTAIDIKITIGVTAVT